MKRLSIPACGALLGLVMILLAPAASPMPRATPAVAALPSRPNIVYILTDDQSMDSMANLPFLASRPGGHWLEFTNAVLSTPLCCPSRASILSGLYAHHTGVTDNTKGKNFVDTSTVATWLKAAGYRTNLVGKYLNEYPFGRGPFVPPGWTDWSAFYGGKATTAYYNYTINDNGTLKTYGSADSDYLTTVLAARAVTFINSTNDPFFLYFAPNAPHYPYTPALKYRTTPVSVKRSPNFNETDVSDKPAWIRNLPALTVNQAKAQDRNKTNAFRTLFSVDDAIRDIYNALDAKGILDNTVIVFMTDNGFAFGEHRLTGKRCVYDECVRTPFLVRYPGTVSRVESRPVSNIDLAPTFAALAGTAPTTAVDGVSLVPLLDGTATSWRSGTLIESIGEPAFGMPGYSGVRTATWKYAELDTGERELYDLANDPYELQNVAGQAAYADTQAQLAMELASLKSGG